MTIRDCPKCGGNHFGSYSCPMEDPLGTHAPKPQAAPSVPDVVRECKNVAEIIRGMVEGKPHILCHGHADFIDRMAAALGVSEANRTMWHDLAQERLGEMQRLESKVTAQAAEVERLTGEVDRALDLVEKQQAIATTAEQALAKADAVIWAYERGTDHWSFNSQAPLIIADRNAAIERHVSRPFAALPSPPLPQEGKTK